ncbi:DNA-(apurinic or apyrimidinic site) lyase [Exophiala xenobiotica]|nr:DNA-(apurinic or apyrimidinic site) lyase [Exophiala xenobiotica]KAK5333923.1 DNA-(apurinic or apyrimidinic site) lyase [Exophiala xenobiotica]KAK5453858.1 DNA-(apurinic or apyrimidinic site) lyase [Exophiala xenobiotica]KAK5495083.1 DNA-(apurinic or apyrimidinic site) lyase [Exophiala xenobiotica]KAK5507625.1 DNA-(apurinic or apyrimidinic site) lyase [Exophiala xenobiotica]
MPKAIKAEQAGASHIVSESPASKKRKRADPLLVETQTTSTSSSRESKRTKAITGTSYSPKSSSDTPRTRRKLVKVEEDQITAVPGQENGSLVLKEAVESECELTETPRTSKRNPAGKGKQKVDVVAADHLEVDQEFDEQEAEPEPDEPLTKQRRSRKSRNKADGDQSLNLPDDPQAASKTGGRLVGRQRKTKSAKEEDPDESQNLDEPSLATDTAAQSKPKRKRKTKAERLAEMVPLAIRNANLKMFVGAHTSVAKGVENAITNCVHIGGNAFACFLKSQRKWENPPLQDGNRDAFRAALLEHRYDGQSHIVPHGSYLVNLATEDPAKAAQSYDTFIDDLHRCEALGIRYYNFHPGGAGQAPFHEAVARLAGNLNRALAETKTVVPLLENMAGHGTLIGGRFSDLRDVIALIKPEYKNRIGVCIDTCHAFAAGYDLRSPEAFQKTMREFDETVGIKYLKALHLNDSKAPLSSHRDLHQNIGLGFLGLRAFHNVMNETRFQGLPLILETPCERPDPNDPSGKKTVDDKSVWATEIKLLESLIGMDPESEVFKSLERELAEKGKGEREEAQRAFDRKVEETRKKAEKEKEKQKEKGQRSLVDMFTKNRTAKKSEKKKGRKKKGKAEESGSEDESSESSSELSELSSDLTEPSEDERL